MLNLLKSIKITIPNHLLCLSFFTALTFNTAVGQVLPTSAAERIEGLKKRKLLDKASVIKGLKFQNIGPSVMSGRVVDVEVNPTDPTEFYVAYATGGLWHTTNNGQSLESIFDREDVMGIGDIAVNWNKGIIWVGTGESNSSRSSYAGLGVYKSMDKGKSWMHAGLSESHHIGEVILHPNDEETAWVAVIGHLYSFNKERGVFKTVDGGKSWKQSLYIDDSTGCIEMDINLSNPDQLFACMWHRERTAWNFVESGNTSGIYRSNDGGDTWQLISGGNRDFQKEIMWDELVFRFIRKS